jgi:hypothetical protein
MGTFLKVFFGLILMGLGFYFIFWSVPFGLMLGLGGGTGFIIQVIIGIALIAGSITLFIKVRR